MQKIKIFKSKRLKAAEPILIRAVVFLVCFAVASGIIGWRIIGSGIVEHYGFQVYGETGKGLLFAALAFVLLIGHRQAQPRLNTWRRIYLMWAVAAASAIALTWLIIGKLLRPHPGILWPVAAHVCIVATIVFLSLFIFGVHNILTMLRAYRREILLSIGLGIIFICFLYAVYDLWTVLSSVVLKSVRAMFGAIGIHASYAPPRTLIFNKFGISVGKYCSGIDSISLFTALYALIGILDWQRFNHKKYLLTFVPALLILFGFNILRVFLLILAGYYINPHIAFSLFHTYAGMVLFIIYSFIFWGVAYKWMLRKTDITRIQSTTESS